MTLGANTAPLAHQQSAAEQIRPDRHAVVVPRIPFITDPDERGGLGEQRQLDRRGQGRGV